MANAQNNNFIWHRTQETNQHQNDPALMKMSEEIEYVDYKDESMIKDIMTLVSRDLSEPYSIFTYRYFLHTWPELCTCAFAKDPDTGERVMIGTVVSKAEEEAGVMQGYIAMLTVDSRFRNKGIGKTLSNINIDRMAKNGCKVIILETEVSFNRVIDCHCHVF
ncbi:N-acetyltransferase [archaeon]|nr:MAG: N-acetyltransferase [archaeon]